ncbi:MAG: hypothetical protein WCJ09_07860 [Planctomycetota bacterium]
MPVEMKANPGGHIAPEYVFGRNQLIELIWDRLEQQCVLINAERRIGKTCIMKRMVAHPRPGWFPVFQDLEKIRSADEFARGVYDSVAQYLGFWKQTANSAKKIFDDYEFGDYKKKERRPWKSLLIKTIEDLMANKEKADQRLVLFWDEVPYMIDNIRKQDGEQAAAEVLDTLRSLRQEHPDLRMVFTGSIGLHHVLASINAAHVATAPVNDMYAIEVTPLAPADAAELAKALIKGEKLVTTDLDVAAAAIADEADRFPFYIHNIVSGLKQDGLRADPEQIHELVERQLVDPNDPWELAHFRTRIGIYYLQSNDAKIVLLILDTLAAADKPFSVSELQIAINSQTDALSDAEHLRELLKLMHRDHYLTRTTAGMYEFRFPLIRRWWKLDRGLS